MDSTTRNITMFHRMYNCTLGGNEPVTIGPFTFYPDSMNPTEILSRHPINEDLRLKFEYYLTSDYPIISVNYSIDEKVNILERADAFFQLAENVLNYCIDYDRRKNMIGILNISDTDTNCLKGYDDGGFEVGRTSIAEPEILDYILKGRLT